MRVLHSIGHRSSGYNDRTNSAIFACSCLLLNYSGCQYLFYVDIDKNVRFFVNIEKALIYCPQTHRVLLSLAHV